MRNRTLTSSSSSVSCSVHSRVELPALACREPISIKYQQSGLSHIYSNFSEACADLGVFLAVEVGPEAKVLQVDGLVFAFVHEALHLLRRRDLEEEKHTTSAGSHAARSRSRHPSRPYRWGAVVQGHEAGWGVGQHGEVGSGRGAHGQRATVGVHLVVHQTPLLQERVNSGERSQFTSHDAETCNHLNVSALHLAWKV